MKKVNLFFVSLVALAAISVGFTSCGGGSSSSSSSTNSTNEKVSNMIQILSTTLPKVDPYKKSVKEADSYYVMKVKNISNKDLSGKEMFFFVHYPDGSIVNLSWVFREGFEPGDVQTVSYRMRGWKNEYGSIEGEAPTKIVLDTSR